MAAQVASWAALPLAAWLLWLLGFFPGMMSPDSSDQWQQALGAPLVDIHPVAHTLLTRLLIQIWPSPAMVALSQIVSLALVWGWGCYSLIELGVSRRALAVSSGLVASSLVVGALVITLWKDVPFSIAMTALAILLARIALGDKPSLGYWVAFGIAASLATLFRHNGIVGLLGAFAGLVLIAPSLWRRAAATLIATLVATFGGRAYLFHAFHARAFWAVPHLMLGILGAHITGGTPMTDPERAVLQEIHPLADEWHYDCVNLGATLYDGEIDWAALSRNGPGLPSLVWALTRKRPLTTLAHQACVTRVLWNPFQGKDLSIGPTLWATPTESIRYVVHLPGGPREASILPRLRDALATWMWATQNARWSWLVWRPALPLYLLVASALFASVRRRVTWPVACCLPTIFNTAGLALAIGTPEIRYQFPVFIAAMLFCPAWLWLGVTAKTAAKSAGESSVLMVPDLSAGPQPVKDNR